ncbi:UNVERIFIED_CONTAM: hypothetical protein GTU68_060526 [Idotea baltica]|nr:hypothetical protein [Idotea baltica]
MAIKYINGADNAPDAVGPYSQATIIEKTVYLSGQIPLNPKTGKLVEGDVEDQANQVMKNLVAVLGHMGLDFSHVVKTGIFLTDLSKFQLVNGVYSKWMGAYRPARATVQVAALPLGAQVEVEMIATLESLDHDILPEGSAKDLEDVASESYSCKS